jgi:hypothetical protein
MAAATVLIACAASRAGAGSLGPADGAGTPAVCTSFSTGGEVHTSCAPSAPAPPGSALACHTYTVGTDTHVECAAVAVPRLGDFREKRPGSPLPAPVLRCSTYHIGPSLYTDCR